MVDYPVQVSYAPDEGQNRLWGIPLLGLIVRSILVIPQVIVLAVIGIVMYFAVLISWAPVLINGRMASWGYTLFGGYIRLTTRVSTYVLLLTGAYPPFGPGGDHTVNVTFDETEEQNRLWGIPLFGIMARWFILIPHFFVLFFLGIVAAVLGLFTWVPILMNGRTAAWAVRWIGGLYRWTARVTAYALLLTGKYPPFSMD